MRRNGDTTSLRFSNVWVAVEMLIFNNNFCILELYVFEKKGPQNLQRKFTNPNVLILCFWCQDRNYYKIGCNT